MKVKKTNTKETSKNTRTPAKVIDPKSLNKLYEDIVLGFDDCEPHLNAIISSIENTTALKNPTKKLLMLKVKGIFDIANEVINKIGAMGKVK